MAVAELSQGVEYYFPLDGCAKPKFCRTGSGAFLLRAHADQLLGSLLRCMNDPTYGEPTLFFSDHNRPVYLVFLSALSQSYLRQTAPSFPYFSRSIAQFPMEIPPSVEVCLLFRRRVKIMNNLAFEPAHLRHECWQILRADRR